MYFHVFVKMPVNRGFQNFSVQSIIDGHRNSAEKIRSKRIWRPYEDVVHNRQDDTETFCAEVYKAFFPQDKEVRSYQQTDFYPTHFRHTDSDSSNTSSPVLSMESSSPSISPHLDNLSPTTSFSNTGSQTSKWFFFFFFRMRQSSTAGWFLILP